jgi:signal transduction histidine kinase
LHGGAMRIRSRLGQGTMVVVRLPAQARPQGRMEKLGAAA